MTDPSRPLRLAELVASLSLAVRLAEAAKLSEADRAAAYYVSLLAWVDCVADSPEMARWFGDDLRIRADSTCPTRSRRRCRKPSNGETATACPADCAATRSSR